MNKEQKLQLSKMISENNITNNTDNIRTLKHSQLILKDVNHLLKLKKTNTKSEEEFSNQCFQECSFLSSKYTDIYNKLYKDELNLTILFKFLDELKKIEDGIVDQHEASFNVGKLLKQLYIDSALKKADKLNKTDKKPEYKTVKNVSWRDFKKKT